MYLLSNITGFMQEDREPLGVGWDRMKEAIRNCHNHGMDVWLILHIFYNALNPLLKTMLGTSTCRAIMGRTIT